MSGSGPSVRLVVIDGPAGAGKTTIARALARRLGLPLLDTGAIYRVVALVAHNRGVDWGDEAALTAIAASLPIEFGGLPPEGAPDAAQRVLVGDEDVTAAIRTPDIAEGASRVSALAGVRAALLDLQRAIGAKGCVAEGRDMGTVVFPDAPHKFFVTADLSARASRRRADLLGGRDHDNAASPTVAEVEAQLVSRDARDSGRQTAPLAQAEDAVLIDTTHLNPEQVIERIVEHLGVDG